MPWMEVQLKPVAEWNTEALEEWAGILAKFLKEKGLELRPSIRLLPGYYVLEMGEQDKLGDLILSAAEKVVLLENLSLKGTMEQEFARFVVNVAGQMGALALCIPVHSQAEQVFWERLGGTLRPDPVPLAEPIEREKIGVARLEQLSILITYEDNPVLCLEPIICNTHASGPISLSQCRVEKKLGGQPIGFASRVAVHCPWEISPEQWTDFLAFSRFKAFDLLSELVCGPLDS